MKTQLYDATIECLQFISVEECKVMLETFDEWPEFIPAQFRHVVRDSLETCVNDDGHEAIGREVA